MRVIHSYRREEKRVGKGPREPYSRGPYLLSKGKFGTMRSVLILSTAPLDQMKARQGCSWTARSSPLHAYNTQWKRWVSSIDIPSGSNATAALGQPQKHDHFMTIHIDYRVRTKATEHSSSDLKPGLKLQLFC